MLKYLARRLLYSFRKDAVTIDALDNKQRNEESDMGNIKAVFVGTGMIGAGLAANAVIRRFSTMWCLMRKCARISAISWIS